MSVSAHENEGEDENKEEADGLIIGADDFDSFSMCPSTGRMTSESVQMVMAFRYI